MAKEPKWYFRDRLSWPFQNQSAVTLWPRGILVRADQQDRPGLKEHEQYHWEQQGSWGPLWYVAYGILFLRYGGGRRHPLERQAYAIEDEVRRQNGL